VEGRPERDGDGVNGGRLNKLKFGLNDRYNFLSDESAELTLRWSESATENRHWNDSETSSWGLVLGKGPTLILTHHEPFEMMHSWNRAIFKEELVTHFARSQRLPD